MDFKTTASITVAASISPAEAVLAARGVPAFEAAVFAAARAGAEARKSATGLTLVRGNVTIADEGTVTVDLVYEKVEASTTLESDPDLPTAEGSARTVAITQPGLIIPSAPA